MKLLLISNSTNAGEEYLGWPRPDIRSFAERHKVKKVLFVPYAGVNLSPDGLQTSFDLYEERVAGVFRTLRLEIESVHRAADSVSAVSQAEAIAVGGGNTFHLVKMMHETGIMQAIRAAVLKGVPYMGWSAGSNVACPTIRAESDRGSLHCIVRCRVHRSTAPPYPACQARQVREAPRYGGV